MATNHRTQLGQRGEDLACREFERRGYQILARRYRTRCGEIDVIASDGLTIVFAEVKTRLTDRFGAPVEAVTRWKQRRICRIAVDYLCRRRLSTRPCRFDIVSVTPDASGRLQVEIIEGAFGAD